jgi:glycosyltransferase involved in cell wall biosynthesis
MQLSLRSDAVPVPPARAEGPPARLALAFVTETYPPELNGVSLTAARAVAYLRGRGHRVELVRPHQPSDDFPEEGPSDGQEILVRGVPLPRYPGLQLGLPAAHLLKERWQHSRPDLVHVVTEGPLGWSALWAARRLGIPVTSDYRTHFHQYSGFYGLGLLQGAIDAALRGFHNRTDACFVATQALAEELGLRGYRGLVCAGRGVDAQLFAPWRRRLGLRLSWGVGEGQLAVLYVGRLAPEKNPGLVIDTFDSLRALCPGARLVWVGAGPLREHLVSGAEAQVFAGVRHADDLAAHYASADLFLFPSLTDTFGNVVLEAMASGLAIVAFDRGAAREHLVHGVSAMLVDPDDPAAFVAAACRLALNPELRRRLGRAARRAAEDLGWPEVLGRFEGQLCRRVSANSGPNSGYEARAS